MRLTEHSTTLRTPRAITDDTQFLIRVDQNLPGNGRLFVKYFKDNVNSLAEGITPAGRLWHAAEGTNCLSGMEPGVGPE